MKNKSEILLQFLGNLGLNLDDSAVYVALMERGELTVLELSKKTKISRTTVYRIIDKLKKKGLIEEVFTHDKKQYKTTPPDTLEALVQSEESRVEKLKELLPVLPELIASRKTINQKGTAIKFYKGKLGIKQMLWNVLNTKTEIVGYTFGALKEVTGEEFENKWILEFLRRKLQLRDIVSTAYSNKRAQAKNEVSTEVRVIDTKKLNIYYQMDIYDNVVSYYRWEEGEIYGVELHDKLIAKMQRQQFELMWGIAKPLKLNSPGNELNFLKKAR